MVFRRRDSRPVLRAIGDFLWPRGGWRRAASYVMHRLRRLPDAPHRIARGIFAGIAVSFLPIFGLHFVAAALLAMLMRGNVIAALLATFAGNPLTFPFMGAAALKTGAWLLGAAHDVPLAEVMPAFGDAAGQLWANARALFGPAKMHWDSLARFYDRVWLPYLVGGIPTGIAGGLAGYYLSLPLIGAYQKHRARRQRERAAEGRGTGGRPPGPG
jgi:uncharacterized protein (DUF2062 family)